jgi:RNA polymerase sigma factor (sigma-70 family)
MDFQRDMRCASKAAIPMATGASERNNRPPLLCASAGEILRLARRAFPEECADETINRLIRKLEFGETIRDIPTYSLGIARLVFLEMLKKPESRQVNLDDLSSFTAPSIEQEDSAQLACFDRCLSELPIESRQLILQYYQDEQRTKINNRQAIADRLGIAVNALRSRVQRIRDKLERCITNCIGGPSPPGDNP